MPTKCKFLPAWSIFGCREIANGSGYCTTHESTLCRSCGQQATHECTKLLGLVCGVPLCNHCQHTPSNNHEPTHEHPAKSR